MTPWPHQIQGIEDVMGAISDGQRRIVLSSPTGMGKTWMVAQLVQRHLSVGKRVLLYTGRRLMLEQLQRDMDEHGIDFGVRAAGYMGSSSQPFQIGSLPTDRTRSKLSGYRDFEADLVIVDEGHLHASGAHDQRLINRHLGRAGVSVVYVTATPIGMGDAADCLIQAGNNSQGRQCGALVMAKHFGPDEPAMANFRQQTLTGLLGLSEKENIKTMMKPGLFGRVLTWFDKLNAERRPTILFAPGVPEARWFAEEFYKKGITAASIDGEEVWINGEVVDPQEGREEVREGSRDGLIQVVCNRFVLREGINWPWLSHCIFATIFTSLQSYLQAGGRMLRNYPEKTATIQDHGGNWWRHGSLNEDRAWSLKLTSRMIAGEREKMYRQDSDNVMEQEPMTCPQCLAVLRKPPCRECGFDFPPKARTRKVIQMDGTPIEMTGKIFRPNEIRSEPDTLAKWRKVYWQMKAAKKPKTFRQAYGYFLHLHGYYPPKDLPYMPATDEADWYRAIQNVDMRNLHPDPEAGARSRTRKKRDDNQGRLFDE